ncbi:hypothetical protein Tco_0624182 [Tanacetum coccineum]|uniref:Reverse transcriptase domain-containing protein n=1 Tax=Tanacetum coccineum TaxID=301880 RepID=A0ABQ4WD42_9ASTR
MRSYLPLDLYSRRKFAEADLALITFPPGNDDLPFDIESLLIIRANKEYLLLTNDPTKETDGSILGDSVDDEEDQSDHTFEMKSESNIATYV